MVKAHFIIMVTSSVVLGSRVSNGLNGCECKYSVVGQGVAGASFKLRVVVEKANVRDSDE